MSKKKPSPRKPKAPAKKRKAPAKPKALPKKRKAPAKPKALPKKRKAPAKPKAPAKKRKVPAKPKALPKKRKAPAKPKVPAKKRKPKNRYVSRRVEQLQIGSPIVTRELQSSHWSKRLNVKALPDTFNRILEAKARKGPFEPQDILVFNHGLKFLGPTRLTKETETKLAGIAFKGAIQVKTVETKVGTEVYLMLGDKPKLSEGVELSLVKRSKYMEQIADVLEDYWGSFDFWLWFETEESLYE